MIKHSLLQAWRRIVKDRTYSIVNIAGLSAGLACFALIALWINDELSFDRFNKNYNRVVRITEMAVTETGETESARTIATMAPALKQDFPEVENAVRLRMREELLVHNGKQSIQPGILLADPSFFDVFSYRLLRGNATTALNEPYTIVLTESTAKKYFGDADPIGQSLTIFMNDTAGNGASYKITGIAADPVQNAHFNFNLIASLKSVEVSNPNTWRDMRFYTYVLLKPGVDMKTFTKKIGPYYKKHAGKDNDLRTVFTSRAQPLAEIYLHSNLQNEIGPGGSITRVYIFSVIGVFILLLAGINYTNLATARSVARAREVGIKKIVGVGKGQLIAQYLSESVLVTLISFLFAVLVALSMQPFFNVVTGKEISLFGNPGVLVFMAGISILIGIVSGIYPAFVLSAFKPVTVLKSGFKSAGSGGLLRKSLVVAQFAITLVLVTGIVIIYAQMKYISKRDLGFNKDALFFIRTNGNDELFSGFNAFKNDLTKNTLIKGITVSNTMIGGYLGGEKSETVDGAGKPLQVTTARIRADQNYLNVFDIRLVAGNNLPAPVNNQAIIPVLVNETAIKKFGWGNAANAIGKPFTIDGARGNVIGIVGDFHFNSLQHDMEPLIIYPVSNRFSRINIRIDGTRPLQSVDFIESTWKKHFPSALMDYAFLDEQLQNNYQSEKRFSKIFLVFSVLSLVIACLGLFGLTAYSIFQKTKEIGIRKVLGASIRGIVLLLSKEFLGLVILAALIAMPVSWWLMNRWLENFAYHIGLSWWMFALPAMLVIVVAFMTVGSHVIRAALANPVKSMRTE
jgi:putative ABC transport system permease protein